MLGKDGYPLSEYDFSFDEFEAKFDAAEIAIHEMQEHLDITDEIMNDEQKALVSDHIDGAIGCITQAMDQYQELVEALVEASEKEFDAIHEFDLVGKGA